MLMILMIKRLLEKKKQAIRIDKELENQSVHPNYRLKKR